MRTEFESHVMLWYRTDYMRILNQIDWYTWLEVPGLPPVTADFSTPEVHEAKKLADDYIQLGGDSSPEGFEKYLSYFTSLKAMF